MRSLRGNRRVQFGAISLVALLAICLVGFLMYNIFTNGGGSTVAEKPTPSAVATEAESDDSASDVTDPTVTPTNVVVEATPTPTESADSTPEADTQKPDPTATVASEAAAEFQPTQRVETIISYEMEQVLENADFEAGFDTAGVAKGWTAFQNDGMLAMYGIEQPIYSVSGEAAQLLILTQANQPDRYAGIYQQVDVTKGKPYTLTMYGQIRSTAGDIETSSYGYRMQYAVDYAGGTNWQNVSDWVELPWDEVPLTGEPTALLSHTTTITPLTQKLTVFVRGWNKWPLGEAHYTIDNLSLDGPTEVVRTIAMVEDSSPAEEAANFSPNDKPAGTVNDLLPVTGNLALENWAVTAQFATGIFVLVLLTIGMGYRWWRYRE